MTQDIPQLPMFPEPPTLEHLLAVAEAMGFVVIVDGVQLPPGVARGQLTALLATKVAVTLDADGRGWTAESPRARPSALRMRCATAIH